MKSAMLRAVIVSLLAILVPTTTFGAAPSRFEHLLAAAKKEGKLHIWYSTPAENKTWVALEQAFEKRFNLKVNVARTFVYSTEQPSRLAAEGRAGVLNADVIQVGLSKPYLDLQKELGLFEVTDWAGIFGSVWPDIKEAADYEPRAIRGYGLALQDFIRVIVYNTNLVREQEVPVTVDGFTHPNWKGKVVFGSPNLDPLTRLSAHPKWTLERAVDVGKKFVANKPLFARGSVAATDMVARGEGVAFLFSSWASYAKRKSEGAPIAFKPFSDFLIVFGNAYAPLRKAPNPNLAKLFVAWYAMEGAQITEKMEDRSSIVHPGTQKRKLYDELKQGRVLVTEETMEDVNRRAEFEKVLRKLVLQ